MTGARRSTDMKKLLFIINPKAGKKKKDYTTDSLAVFKNAGYATKIVSTRKRADGTLLAKKYGDRVDLIVCMGGDGTLNEVIEGMLEAHCKTPLGYIPAGSTNDFAASLRLNSNPVKQAQFIISHEPRLLDMGCFNGRYFVYTAAAGIFAKTSFTTPQELKNRLGHAAYILSGIKELFHIQRMHLKIDMGVETVEGYYIFAAINNATKVGGIMKLDEELVKFNDGVFELLLVPFPKNPIEFLKLVRKIFRQDFTGKITLKQIQQAKISGCEKIEWSLDGEEEKGGKTIEFHVVSDAVMFIY